MLLGAGGNACGLKAGSAPRRRCGRWIARCLLFLGLAAAFSAALPAQDANWRRDNDRKNRYEGRVGIPVSGPDLDLVSFVGASEDFVDSVELKVRFFLPEAMPVRLLGQELRVEKQYLMEAKPADWRPGQWNEFGPWQTSAVIDREGVAASNLGFLIRERKSSGGRLVPAFLYHSEVPRDVRRYVVVVKPREWLSRVTYSLRRADGAGEKLDAGQKQTERGLEPNGPIRLYLKAREIPEGWLRVEVSGSYKSKPGGARLEFDFYHQPKIGEPE